MKSIRNRPAARAGYSLMELLVVIAIASTMLGMIGTVAARLFRGDRAERRGMAEQVALGRLMSQWRSDVRAARDVTVGEGGDVVCQGDDAERIEYRVADGVVTRFEERETGQAREEYLLPAGSQATVDVAASGANTRAMLTVSFPRLARPNARRVEIRGEALVGRDRHLGLPQGKESP